MMKKFRDCLILVLATCLLAACSLIDSRPPAMLYDLGPLQIEAMGQLPQGMPNITTKVYVPDWMDDSLMVYRLDYVNDQQVRFYTESSWASAPSKLFRSRMDAYLMAIGNRSASTLEGEALSLRIIFEDFSQHFTDVHTCIGRVAIRATLYKGQELIDQQRFIAEESAVSADAVGGARALSKASDAVIANIMNWVVIKGGH
ncbi:MAG: hypothetical protein ACI4NO_04195 [Oxalobacter sp.]